MADISYDPKGEVFTDSELECMRCHGHAWREIWVKGWRVGLWYDHEVTLECADCGLQTIECYMTIADSDDDPF